MTDIHDIIKRQISEIPRLATLSTVAIEIADLVDQDDISLHPIKQLLQTDPALTIKVLKVANSPYYGARSRVHHIDQAIALIGLNELCNILLSVATHSKMFHLVSSKAKEFQLLWNHSIVCGYMSKLIATRYYIHTAGREYIAGLLHDIGKIILIEYYSKELEQICSLIEHDNITDLDAEMQVLGITHEDIGYYLGEAWGLPKTFNNVIRHHHSPRQDSSNMLLNAVVHVADFLCRRWDIRAFEEVPQSALINDEGWQILLEEQSNMVEIDPEQIDDELRKELENIPLSQSRL